MESIFSYVTADSEKGTARVTGSSNIYMRVLANVAVRY